jgi:hypothetical protein
VVVHSYIESVPDRPCYLARARQALQLVSGELRDGPDVKGPRHHHLARENPHVAVDNAYVKQYLGI